MVTSNISSQKTYLVSPHQYHTQQRSQENGPDEETSRNKMGSQHEDPDPGLHRNCQTPHGVCLQYLVICCKDQPGSANHNPKCWTENNHRWHEDQPHLRVGKDSRPAVIREKERGKYHAPKRKDEEASFTPITLQVEAPTKNRLKRQNSNHLVKARQQKHRIPSSTRNKPLEILQNYEDWQAETPTIILDIPGIQAKDHHTAEELRSLTLEALSVAYPSTTWARAYTDGSAEETAKNGGGGVFIKLPNGRSIRKSVATGQQSTNYRAEALLAAAQTLDEQERLPVNAVF